MATDKAYKGQQYTFLQGGGEMGKLMRTYDWSQTVLGTPDQWPQSLRTTISIILNSRFPMFLFWGPELICFYNDAYRPSLGNDGKHPSALGAKGAEVWPEIWAFIKPLIDQVMTGGGGTWNEDQLLPIYRNGKLEDVYWTFSYSPVTSEQERIEGVLVVCTETTRQITARKAVEESEQDVRSIVESAPFPIGVYIGKEMRIAFTNQTILDTWGRDSSVVGKRYAEVLTELDPIIYEQLDSVFTTGEPFHARNVRIDLLIDGRMKPGWFNYSFTPLHNAKGEVYGVMNTGADVTDLNLAKQKIEENERSFRNTILKAPVAMCIFKGPNHVVEVANDRMIELWGTELSKVKDKPIFEGLPEAAKQGFEELLDNVYNTGETFAAQGVPIGLNRGGRITPVYVNFVYEAYKEAGGEVSGVLAVATDVTEQVLARQKIEEIVGERTHELAQANISLQKSNSELAQFAYIASHDLQEPLRKVSTFTDMLKTNLGNVDERSKNYLDKITNASGRMLALIRDVLTYSQLSGEGNIFSQVDLRDVIENVKTDFELLIEQKGAVVRYSPLPIIEAIPLQMSQLFGNLISNALKFTRPGVPPTIDITVTALTKEAVAKWQLPNSDGTYFDIEIRDNGIGFNKEYADKIFNIFQRLHGKQSYAGTGIGLAICKKIAQNHHGDIDASQSSEEHGAVFNVILPLRQGK